MKKDISFPALFFLSLLLPGVAFAQATPPTVFCAGLPGCNASDYSALLSNGIPVVGSVMVGLAAGLAVVAILYGGFLMLVAAGDDGKVEKGKQSIMYGLGGIALALSAQQLVAFLVTEPALQTPGGVGMLGPIQGLLAAAVKIGLALFNTVLIIVVIIAGMRLLYARGKSDEAQKAINMLKYAFVGAVVANLSRALVEALINTFAW